MEEKRYQVCTWVRGWGWLDAIGQSLSVEELAKALPDLLRRLEDIRIKEF